MGALPGRPQVYRDPVHGDIAYPKGVFQELVRNLVDTELFQRLRGIRQNGVTHLVFQGAEHSRFAHSMGVAHMAARMFDAAIQNSGFEPGKYVNEREATILAALLHDVGHGPFSHLLEEILGRDHFDHEKMTARILVEEDSKIHELLEAHREGLADELVQFVDKKERKPERWYHAIVSSQLDADRLDYLARDAHMAGVFSHHFDADRLISFLGVHGEDLVVDERARDVLENYLLALDQMYQAVYYHHTVRCASLHLTWILKRAIVLARQTASVREKLFPDAMGAPDPMWILAESGNGIPLEAYCHLDEVHAWHLIRGFRAAEDPTLRVLCEDFAVRRFPKSLDLPSNEIKGPVTLERRAKAIFKEQRPNQDADYNVGIDEANRLSYKRYRAGEGASGSIKVVNRAGQVKPLEELERSVVKVIDEKAFFNRLMMPAFVRDARYKESNQDDHR
jgi:HD superfamily phosphohydrolase